jgi:SLT domain-containing protein
MYGTSVNPLANTFAGLHYALGRYHSLSALNRPGGYDSGGLLQPGATMAVNRTGRPERVLNADHTAKLDALLTNSGGAGVTIQAVNISGTFDFSSPADRRRAANELVEEMKEALRNLDNSRQRGGRRR